MTEYVSKEAVRRIVREEIERVMDDDGWSRLHPDGRVDLKLPRAQRERKATTQEVELLKADGTTTRVRFQKPVEPSEALDAAADALLAMENRRLRDEVEKYQSLYEGTISPAQRIANQRTTIQRYQDENKELKRQLEEARSEVGRLSAQIGIDTVVLKDTVSTAEEILRQLKEARETNKSLHRRVQAVEGPWEGRLHAALNDVHFAEENLRRSRRTEAIAVRTLKEVQRELTHKGGMQTLLDLHNKIEDALDEIRKGH